MHAQMWLSVFRVPDSGQADRPPGVYGAAFVSYEQGSPLLCRELLVARLVDPRRRVVTITDIWVDSRASRDGGRSLWAIPKELAGFDVDERHLGPTSHTDLAARAQGRALATAEFAALPGASLVRTPYSAWTSQRRDGSRHEVRTSLHGSARGLPALATWEFATDGPLGWLAGRRPLVSFRLRDVRLTFG